MRASAEIITEDLPLISVDNLDLEVLFFFN